MDSFKFLGELARHPSQIAAIAPSSPALAQEMISGLSLGTGRVLELGPGTGVFTRALIAAGCREEDLDLVEMNASFARDLGERFPTARIHNLSAGDLDSLAPMSCTAILSGLPVLSMGEPLQRAILHGIRRHLAPGSPYIQFTYGRKPPYPLHMLDELGFSWTCGRRVWRNLPPARVYRFLLD